MLSAERSLGELFSQLSQDVSTLFRQEVRLAKIEVSQIATEAGKQAGIIGAGGAIAYAGFLALLAALILGLSEFMAAWLAALIVGLVVAGIGYFIAQKGLNDLKTVNPAPEKTIQTIKEDGQWLKQQVS
jgi:drug/metabolite transporter (DMT)-like permease